MKEKRSRDLEKKLAALALLALLGLLGGAAMRARLRGGGGASASRASRAARGSDGATMTPQAAAVWSRLLAALSAKGSPPVTLESLARRLLQLGGGDPLAKAFAEDFLRNPELLAIWNEYARSGGKLDAAWLADRLSNSKGFAALVNRYSNHWRFRRLGDALARLLGGETPSEGAAGLPGSGGPDEGGSWAQDGRRSDREAGSARVAARGIAAAGASGAGGTFSAEQAGGQNPKAVEAHRTLRLIAPRAAGPDVERDPWASLCFQGNSQISREQCAAINRHLGEDALWNACYKAGLLDKCVTLCRGNLDLGCEAQAREMLDCRRRSSAEDCADACSRGDCRAATPSQPEPGPTVAALPPVTLDPVGAEPEPPPAADRTLTPGAAPEPTADPKVTLPIDHAVPRGTTVAPMPPPQPTAPPKKKKKRFPPTWEEIVDFLEDLFG